MANNTAIAGGISSFPAPKALDISSIKTQGKVVKNPFGMLKTATVLAIRFWKVWIPPVWLIFMFILPIGMFAVFGLGKVYSDFPFANVTISAMIMANMAQYSVFSAAAALACRIGVEANNGWLQQIKASPVSLGCYNLSRIIAIVVISLFQVLGVYLYGAINGVTMPVKPFLGSLLALTLTIIFSALIGLTIGVIMKTDAASSVIGSASWLIAMFSGMYMPLDQLGDFFVKLGYFMPLWGTNQVLMYGLGDTTAINIKVIANIVVWTVIFLIGLYYGSRRAVKR